MFDASSCPFVKTCPSVAVILDRSGLPDPNEKPQKVCHGCASSGDFVTCHDCKHYSEKYLTSYDGSGVFKSAACSREFMEVLIDQTSIRKCTRFEAKKSPNT